MSTITLSGRDLYNLWRVSMARSYDTTKPTLSGVIIEPRGADDLVAAATDGFVLAFCAIHYEGHGLTEKILVPASMSAEIMRRKLHQTSYLVIDQDGFRFFHKAGGIGTIAAHREAGWSYPSWTKVLPTTDSLRGARPEEVVFSHNTWQKAMSAFNGGKVEYPIEIRDGAIASDKSGVIFNTREGVTVATMPVRFSASHDVVDMDPVREGLMVALRGVAA